MGRFDHPPIREASGIVRGRAFPEVFWVHNDSGHPPRLFAVRKDGGLVREFAVGAPSIDWEDIAADGAGNLYLADTGNNGARLPLRAIYRVDEPDPDAPGDGPLAVNLAVHYGFDPGGRFDSEALVIDGGRAVLISKRLDGEEADLYALPIDRPAPLLRPATPERLGTLPGFREPATGADLSADGHLLAVCSLGVARVYERRGDGWEPIGEVRFDLPDQIEAIAWAGLDLILAGERRGMYRIAEETWRGRPPGRRVDGRRTDESGTKAGER